MLVKAYAGNSMFLLLFSFLSIVFLIAVLSNFHSRKIPNWLAYLTIITAVVYPFSLKRLESLLFGMGGISVMISLPTTPFLIGGTEA
jgi:Flp pilus assembly protein protease CpaA